MAKDTKDKQTLVILDAHAILHRAYHALPDFSSSKGEPTGALYGVAAMLIRILRELEPDYIVAAYDLPEPTFRHEAYENYKAGRPEAEDALVQQINRSRDIFEAFGIPMYEVAGYEADDVIGTIVEELKDNKDINVIIASGDMDTLQLVRDDEVTVFTLRKGIQDTVTYNEDAVKKRFGFEPELLPDYKGLCGDPSDNIIGISGIGDKTATELITKFGSIDDIYNTLKDDEEKLKEGGIKPRIINLLRENEEEALFSKTLAIIRRDAPIDFTLPDTRWADAFDIERASALFDELEFRTLRNRLQDTFGEKDSEEDAKEEVREVSEQELEEMKIALWLLHSETTTPTREDIVSFTQTEDMVRAKEILLEKIKEHDLERVYNEIELPLMPIIEAAEKRGIKVDTAYLKELSQDYHKQLESLEQKIWKAAGREFNINSPKQLGEVLFDEMGLSAKGLKKTSGGARSTRESELLKLQGQHEIIDNILSYRELQKLLSTYIDTIPDMVGEDGRLHTQLNQTGTTTGRMSSKNPNMQNIPVRDGLGGAIRNAFVAEDNHLLMAFDYSQIEIRVLAELSGDERLCKIFTEGGDVHSGVASYMFDVKEGDITKDMRRQAKVVNFGIIYGMGVNALKQNLGVSQKEAQEFYNNYFEQFPGVTQYLENTKKGARKNGYTTTRYGRRRYFDAIQSSVPYIRASAERMATNAPIQGTGADIMKMAIIEADKVLRKNNLRDNAHLLLTVHDELIYEVHKDARDDAYPLIKETMEQVGDLRIPLVVDVSEGSNWGELKKITE